MHLMLHWGLTLPPSHLWRLCLELVSTKFDCPNVKGSTAQLQHLQYVQLGGLVSSHRFNMFQQSNIVQYQDWKQTMFWVCEPMLCLQAPCHCCLQRNINALNEVLDSQPPFPCIHDLTKDSLDCLLTKRCKLKAKGISPILAAETCIAFKMHGETTLLCEAGASHSLRSYEEFFQPYQHTSPIRGRRYDLQCKNFVAQSLEGTMSNLKPSKTIL